MPRRVHFSPYCQGLSVIFTSYFFHLDLESDYTHTDITKKGDLCNRLPFIKYERKDCHLILQSGYKPSATIIKARTIRSSLILSCAKANSAKNITMCASHRASNLQVMKKSLEGTLLHELLRSVARSYSLLVRSSIDSGADTIAFIILPITLGPGLVLELVKLRAGRILPE
jgi:hypothetical protein